MLDEEINKSYQIFEKLTKKPQDYLSCQENITDTVRELVKNLYDVTKCSENKISGNTALPELIVDSFDEEQIWQELELQNNDWNNTFVSNITNLAVKKDNVVFPVHISGSEDDPLNEKINKLEPEETGNTKVGTYDDDSSYEKINAIDFEDVDDDSNGSEYSISSDIKNEVARDLDQNSEKLRTKTQGKHTVSEVDDKFFKLSEMETFLEIEEQKDEKGGSENRYDNNDSDVDFFADELEDEGYGIEKQKDGADYKYEDFFAPPEDSSKNNEGSVRFEIDEGIESETGENMLTDNSDSIDDLEDVAKNETKETKSSFEERQERLQSKIKRLEEEALQEKPWQLSGEVVGAARPQNSLLEEFVDFDIMTRPAPVITEETTMRLEDIILRRIKDKAWDDVERKVKPVESTELFKKPFVLDQEKSKLSLADVYEQEYLKQRDSIVKNQEEYNEKKDLEPELHTEVRAMMVSLFNKLDALSNFHYTPRPVVPELKVVSNIPAINMEEVAPVAASNSMLLTPEEIQGNSFKKIINKNEQTVTDKKRALRRKKKKQRKRAREMREKNMPTIGKKSVDISNNKFKKHKAEEKINALSTTNSSKTFFSSLQEEVSSNIKRKRKSVDRSKKLEITAAHLKL